MTHRIIALLRRAFALTLALLLALPALPALAEQPYDVPNVQLSWTDSYGTPQSVMATPFYDSLGGIGYWAQVGADAPFGNLWLSVSYPGHEGVSFLPDSAMPLQNVIDAGGSMDGAYITISAMQGDMLLNTYTLFVSVQPMPAPQPPALYPVDIPVYYTTSDGASVASQTTVTIQPEGTMVVPQPYDLQANYEIVGEESHFVTLNPDNTPSESSVTFVYQYVQPPLTAVDIPVYYTTSDGASVASQTTATIQPEGTTVVPQPYDLQPNYEIVGEESHFVTLNPDNTPTESSVTFVYQYVQPPLTAVDIPVYYTTSDGASVASQTTATIQPEGTTVYPQPYDLQANYEIVGEESHFVTLNPDNTPSESSITFVYQYVQPPLTAVDIPVYYTTSDGASVASQTTATIQPEGTTVVPQPYDLQANYEIVGEESHFVTLNPDNTPSESSVTFVYQYVQPPLTAVDIPVYYTTSDGASVASQTTATIQQEGTTVVPQPYDLQANYEIVGEESYYVTLNPDNTPSESSITFIYQYVQPPLTVVDIPVHYTTAEGTPVATDTTATIQQEGTTVVPQPYDLQANYEIVGEESHFVTLNPDNTSSESSITFIYQYVQPAPDAVDIPVHYQAMDGTPVATDTTVTIPRTGVEVLPQPIDLREGYTLRGEQLTGAPSVFVNLDEAGTPSFSGVTFLYDAPAAPQPPVKGSVTVHYVDGDSQPIAEPIVLGDLSVGETTVAADLTHVPEGYQLSGEAEQTVAVSDSGVTTPGEIYFVFNLERPETPAPETPAPETPTPEIGPLDPAAPYPVTTIIQKYGQTNDTGVKVRAEPSTSGSKLGSVSNKGTKLWVYGAVSDEWYAVRYNGTDGFMMAKFVDILSQQESDEYNQSQPTPMPGAENTAPPAEPPAPVQAQVTLHYTDGTSPIASDTVTTLTGAGEHTVTPASAEIPADYALQEPASAVVTVSESGTAAPAEVTFTYAKPQAPAEATATITVRYLCDGAPIAADQTLTLIGALVHPVSADASLIPAGYQLIGEGTQTVSVSEEGVATPAQVEFQYQSLSAVTGSVTVHYTDGAAPIAADQTVSINGTGEHAVAPDMSLVPAGYTLVGEGSQTVSLSADGAVSPAELIFTFAAPVVVSGSVTVHYVTNTGATLIADQQAPLTGAGEHTVLPDAALIPAGYSLSGDASKPVILSENGKATPSEITFTYKSDSQSMYTGYALTTERTPLRADAKLSDSAIITMFEQNTLLYLHGQGTVDGVVWSSCQTVLGQSQYGFVQDSMARHITNEEAQALIDAYNAAHATPTPSPTPSPTPMPPQLSGYYMTLGDNVPLRTVTSVNGEISVFFPKNTVVYVAGQVYNEDTGWHISSYGTLNGYVRYDQLRKLSDEEVQQYLASLTTPTPTPAVTVKPYDPNATSSYGYVTKNAVNFRTSPNGTVLKQLNQYAFALILESRNVSGTTWYHINQNGVEGWISGGFFKVLSLAGLEDFLTSYEYLQGLSGSTGSTGSTVTNRPDSGNTSTGSATSGTIGNVEDWNVDTWKNPNANLNVTYEPFNPYATPSVTNVPTEEPGADASAEPTDAFVPGTMIPFNYEEETKETTTGTVPWGIIALGGVLLAGGAGVYAYALNQNKKRKAAARAAASRRTAQQNSRAQQGQQNPYARRAVAAPPANTQAPRDRAAGYNASPYGRPAQTGTSADQKSGSFAPPMTGAGQQTQTTGNNPYAPKSANPYAPQGNAGHEGYTASPYGEAPAAPSAGNNSYAPQGDAGYEGYTAPTESRPAASPYGEAPAAPSAGNNPYAPQGDGLTGPQSSQSVYGQSPATPRQRTPRTQRYRASHNDDE